MSTATETSAVQGSESAIARGTSGPPRSKFIPGPPTVYDAIDGLQVLLDAHGDASLPRRILEAGCGSTGYLRIRPRDHLVGIDISQDQLARNSILNEKILGDLQTYPLPRRNFDVVVCWYVLEHLPYPDRALENMIASMKPGGLLIIGVPSVTSFKGLVTKFTPHWFHVLVHRRLFRRKEAGLDGHPPFPTFLRRSIGLGAMTHLAAARGMHVERCWRFEDYTQRKLRTRSPLFRMLFRVARGLTAVPTMNLWNIYLTDYAIALRLPEEGAGT